MNTKKSLSPGTPILIGIGFAVMLGLLVALALADSNVRDYEPGTPEAAAQLYVKALFDEDRAAAYALLTPEVQDRCEQNDLDLWWVRDADSASFDEVRVSDGHAEIELRLVGNDIDPGLFPFDNYDYSRETELVLDQIDGEWLVSDATWPLAGCNWR